MRQLILGWTWEICRWMFPKIVGFPPKSSQFNRGFPLQTIHFGGKIPDFLETPRWQASPRTKFCPLESGILEEWIIDHSLFRLGLPFFFGRAKMIPFPGTVYPIPPLIFFSSNFLPGIPNNKYQFKLANMMHTFYALRIHICLHLSVW